MFARSVGEGLGIILSTSGASASHFECSGGATWDPLCIPKEHLVATLSALSAVGAFVIAQSVLGATSSGFAVSFFCGRRTVKAHEVLNSLEEHTLTSICINAKSCG